MMGIRNLNKLIEQFAPQCHQHFDLQNIKQKDIGIDALLWLYELKYRHFKTKTADFETSFHEKLKPIVDCEPSNIFFIFDGKPPIEKHETLKRRREDRRRMSLKKIPNLYIPQVTSADLQKYKDIIKKTSNMCIIQGKDEGEATLARLQQNNVIQFIFSNDTDILPFGSSYIFKKYNQWIKADVNILKNKLDLSQEQLVELCVLLGNDFNPGVRRIGPVNALRIIQGHKCIDDFFNGTGEMYRLKGNYTKFDFSFIHARMQRSKALFTNVLGDYHLNNRIQ